MYLRFFAVGVVNNFIFNVIIILELSQDFIFVMIDKFQVFGYGEY